MAVVRLRNWGVRYWTPASGLILGAAHIAGRPTTADLKIERNPEVLYDGVHASANIEVVDLSASAVTAVRDPSLPTRQVAVLHVCHFPLGATGYPEKHQDQEPILGPSLGRAVAWPRSHVTSIN